MSKQFKFHLPDQMFEEFFRLFPAIGERSRFLRRVVSLAIQRKDQRSRFEEEISELASVRLREGGSR